MFQDINKKPKFLYHAGRLYSGKEQVVQKEEFYPNELEHQTLIFDSKVKWCWPRWIYFFAKRIFIEKTFQEFYFPNFKFLNICPEVVPALSSMASNEVIDKYQPQKHFFSSPKIEKSPKRCQNEITSISFVGK